MKLFSKGNFTLSEIALRRYREDRVPMEESVYLVNELFLKGFLNEDPKEQGEQKKMMENAHL